MFLMSAFWNRENGYSSLPNELIISIINQACDGKENYRTLVLLNRRTQELVEAEDILIRLPIRINAATTSSFLRTLIEKPGFADKIRYIWITGPTFKRLDSATTQDIVMRCQKLVSLACTTSLLYILCSTIGSMEKDERKTQFMQLRELTLFAEDYTSWLTLREVAVEWITPRITHLRLQYRVPPSFGDVEEEEFLSLTHYSIAIRQPFDSFPMTEEELENIVKREKLEKVVLTTYEPPEEVNTDLLKWNDALEYVFLDKSKKRA